MNRNEKIYLIDMGDEITWCDCPDPSGYVEPEDVTTYIRIDVFNKEIKELQEQLKVREETEKGLRLVIKTIADELGINEPRCKYITSEISDLQEQLKQLEKDNELYVETNESLADEIEQKDKEILTRLTIMNEQAIEKGRLLGHMEELKAEIEQKDKEIESLREQLKYADGEDIKLKARNETLKRVVEVAIRMRNCKGTAINSMPILEAEFDEALNQLNEVKS